MAEPKVSKQRLEVGKTDSGNMPITQIPGSKRIPLKQMQMQNSTPEFQCPSKLATLSSLQALLKINWQRM